MSVCPTNHLDPLIWCARSQRNHRLQRLTYALRFIESGAQPLTNADDSIILAVNGEIYNHRLIRKNLKNPYHFKTHSDCEVVIPLVRTPELCE